VNWIFALDENGTRRRWLPDLFVGDRANPGMPADFQFMAPTIAEQRGQWEIVDRAPPAPLRYLLQLDGYVQRFPLRDELFHPGESAANLLAALISGAVKQNPAEPPWARTQAWAE